MAITLRNMGASVGGTTSLALAQPSGTTTGDVLVAFVLDHSTAASGNSAAPTGWTYQGGMFYTAGRRFQIFTAVVGQNGLTGTSWTFLELTSRAQGVIGAWYGANSVYTDCLDTAVSSRYNNSTTQFGTTGITTVTDGALVVAVYGSYTNGSTWGSQSVATSPAITEIFDAANLSYSSISIATGIKAVAGATGASTATMTTATTANGGLLFAIKPGLTGADLAGSTAGSSTVTGALTTDPLIRTISNAGGNWNATTTWVEGLVPRAVDTVVATATSGNITLNASGTCASIDLTNYVGTFTHNNGYSLTVAAGGLKFSPGMTYTPANGTCAISFTSPSNNGGVGWPITFAGKQSCSLNFSSNGGKWVFQDAVTMPVANPHYALTLSYGTLDTNNQSIKIGKFYLGGGPYLTTLNLGSSTVELTGYNTGAVVWDAATNANTTINAGTSVIKLTGAGAGDLTFNGGGYTYNEVQFLGSATYYTINGNNTFTNLKFLGPNTQFMPYLLGGNQTVSGVLTLQSYDTTKRIIVGSSVAGTQRTLTVNGSVAASYVDFSDIRGAGSASWDLSAIPGGSGDRLGNTDIIFTPGFDPFKRTISNAGGNWNAVTTWVEGAVPTSADRVTATATSGNVTINVASACGSLDLTNYVGTLTHGNNTLSIGNSSAGLLKFSAGMTYTPSPPADYAELKFVSTSNNGGAGWPITLAGKIIGSMTFDGVGGKWVLQDAVDTSGTNGFCALTLTNGTLDTNNQNLTLGKFVSSTTTGTRTLNLGSSIITIDGAPQFGSSRWNVHSSLTLNAGTAAIRLTGGNTTYETTFIGGGFTYPSLEMSGAGIAEIKDANTFGTLTRTGPAAVTNELWLYADQTVTGTFTVTGGLTADKNRMFVHSDTLGISRKITANAVSAAHVDFQDITGAGAATWDLSAITGGSGDCQGNSGIAFTTPMTMYWYNGSTSFSDATKWYRGSGGSGGSAGRLPLPQDTMRFDANSAIAGLITADMKRVGTIDWTGATAGSFGYGLVAYHYGSFIFPGATPPNITGTTIYFQSRNSITINTGNKSGLTEIYFRCIGGTVNLGGALKVNQLRIENGTFNANSYDVNVAGLYCNSGLSRTVNMGSGTWSFTNSWTVAAAGLTFNCGTSKIAATDTSNTSFDFNGGGLTYNDIEMSGPASGESTGKLTFYDSNTFRNFKINPGKPVNFESGKTTTITGNFTAVGASGRRILINTTSTGNAILSKASGIVPSDYLSLTKNTAQGGATFYAGSHSTDGGGNTGWTWADAPFTVAVAGSSTLVGELSSGGGPAAALAGAITATSTIVGTVSSLDLVGSVTGGTVITATLLTGSSLLGTSSGTSTVATATLTTSFNLQGSILGTSTVIAALTTASAVTLAGIEQGTSTLIGNLVTEIMFQGTVQGTATIVGSVETGFNLVAVVEGLTTVVGTITTELLLAGASTGSAEVVAFLTIHPGVAIEGSIWGSATTTGTLETELLFAANLLGTSLAVGKLSVFKPVITVSNAGSPLVDPKGTPLVGITVTFKLVNKFGKPVIAWDRYTHQKIEDTTMTAVTDNNGEFALDLWPTTRATSSVFYLCSVEFNNVKDFIAPLLDEEYLWADFWDNRLYRIY